MSTRTDEHDDDLVTLVTKANEMEAAAVVAILEDAGIEARAFSALQTVSIYTGPVFGVPVQVRRNDLDRAYAALKQNVADSVDLDWDEVDVGQPEEDVAPTPAEIHRAHETQTARSMPLIVQAGFFLAIVLALLMFVMFVATLLNSWP